MTSIALVSVLAPDRIGLVAAIADYLFGVGVNLRDASFAALGTGAEFAAVCDLSPTLTHEELETGLKSLPELAEAQVRVAPYLYKPDPAAQTRVTHRINVSGGDQLGLVARLADIFAQYEANIVRLEARKLSEGDGGLYVTRFAVSIEPASADICLAAVANTAGALGLSCDIERSAL
jgi:glycine cleavage system transcriptional repressor